MPIIDAEKYIAVHIWTSQDNRTYPGHNVGHVSIEISSPQLYVSLWPAPFTLAQEEKYRLLKEKIKSLESQLQFSTIKKMQSKLEKLQLEYEQQVLRYFGERDVHYRRSLNDDKMAERNQSPQLTFYLYSLDREKMLMKFNEIKRGEMNWRLVGSNQLVQTLENITSYVKQPETGVSDKPKIENCSSLAFKLLEAGGIYNLISSLWSSNFSSVITPDQLADAILAAKEQELNQYPETKQFYKDLETKIEKESNGYCTIS